MAALVTLDQAKDHLHIDQDDTSRDVDVLLKATQASDIVLDYLKVRSATIASISVASPTVITTTLPHSLVSGDTVTIAGTTTTPTVVGAQVVTVTSPTTFTVPVAVTVGQAEEAGTAVRGLWTTSTVPGRVQAATLLMLGRLFEHRGDEEKADADCWMAIERLLMRSRDPALA
jgi:hypothetical protein